MKYRYWFYTKQYGWGWGLPATWEGWCVRCTYLVILVLAPILIPPHRLPGWFTVVVTVATTIFGIVAWKTGEPPRWRWGKNT